MIILLFWMHFIIGNALPATSGSEAGKLPDIPVGGAAIVADSLAQPRLYALLGLSGR